MEPDKQTFEGKRVVVTGGAGFIGSHIIDLLAQADPRQIVAVDNMVRGCPDNLAQAQESGRVVIIKGDIRNLSLMEEILEGADIVFHQAALRITHCAAEPAEALGVMVDATFNLFEACVRRHVRKVVFASSASVYGMAEEFPTSERNHPYANRTLYGAAKTFGEGLLRSFYDMYGLDYVALRYFNVYGPRMDLHGRYTEVLIRWMERIEAGEPPIIFGDGTQSMDFVDVRDVARANLLAASSVATDVALNVGAGVETTLAGLAQTLADTMGRSHLVPLHAPERAVNPVRRRLADTRAARERIGFNAAIPLHEGLRDLVAWWRRERQRNMQEAAE